MPSTFAGQTPGRVRKDVHDSATRRDPLVPLGKTMVAFAKASWHSHRSHASSITRAFFGFLQAEMAL